MIRGIQSNFKKEIGDLGSDNIRTDRLSNGAIISKIFHNR